jgi:hypothetical protein
MGAFSRAVPVAAMVGLVLPSGAGQATSGRNPFALSELIFKVTSDERELASIPFRVRTAT